MALDLSAYKPVTDTVTDASLISSAFTAIETFVNALPTATVAAGVVAPFGGSSAPTGWLICDGSAVSRTTYASLFSAIGTTYGVGNGTTTFNLPDLRGRMVTGYSAAGHADVATLGATDGTALASRRPKHKHTVVQPTISITDPGHSHTVPARTQNAPNASTNAAGNFINYESIPTSVNTTGITAGAAGGTVGPQTGAEPTDGAAYIVLTWVVKT